VSQNTARGRGGLQEIRDEVIAQHCGLKLPIDGSEPHRARFGGGTQMVELWRGRDKQYVCERQSMRTRGCPFAAAVWVGE
jgi:hypothetical protein